MRVAVSWTLERLNFEGVTKEGVEKAAQLGQQEKVLLAETRLKHRQDPPPYSGMALAWARGNRSHVLVGRTRNLLRSVAPPRTPSKPAASMAICLQNSLANFPEVAPELAGPFKAA